MRSFASRWFVLGAALVLGCGGEQAPPLADAGAASCADKLIDGDETGVDCGGPCPACGPGVGCFGPNDCRSRVCQDFLCVAESCGNGRRDFDETDLDCGGGCGPCVAGHTCISDGDCASGRCVAQVCSLATCRDGQENQDETGVDCGGTCTLAGLSCANGQNCQRAADCQSGLCTDFVCRAR